MYSMLDAISALLWRIMEVHIVKLVMITVIAVAMAEVSPTSSLPPLFTLLQCCFLLPPLGVSTECPLCDFCGGGCGCTQPVHLHVPPVSMLGSSRYPSQDDLPTLLHLHRRSQLQLLGTLSPQKEKAPLNLKMLFFNFSQHVINLPYNLSPSQLPYPFNGTIDNAHYIGLDKASNLAAYLRVSPTHLLSL